MPWFSKANEYEKPINVATSVGNIDANWQTILAVSDKLQLDDSAGQGDAVEAMLARLKTGNAKVQVQAIKLMKACAANVGKKFQVALCCHPFATEIKKMLAPRSATKPEVQAELKGALVEWREWARQDPQLHMMETTISDLERMGVSMVVVDPAAQKREEEQRRAQEKEKEELELALALSQSAAEANGGGGTAMAAPAPSPGASGGFRPRPAKCLYTFEGTEDGELSFSAGDIVVITNKSDDNWWKGSNAAGTEGYFPASFVTFDMEAQLEKEVMPEAEPAKPQIDEAKIDKCLDTLYDAMRDGSFETLNQMTTLRDECLAMEPLLDKQVQAFDSAESDLRKLNERFERAMAQYEELKAGPEFVSPAQQVPPMASGGPAGWAGHGGLHGAPYGGPRGDPRGGYGALPNAGYVGGRPGPGMPHSGYSAPSMAPRRAMVLDSNGDGRVDKLTFDASGDGRIDSVAPSVVPQRAMAFDSNGDGRVDKLAFDANGDGRIDSVMRVPGGSSGFRGQPQPAKMQPPGPVALGHRPSPGPGMESFPRPPQGQPTGPPTQGHPSAPPHSAAQAAPSGHRQHAPPTGQQQQRPPAADGHQRAMSGGPPKGMTVGPRPTGMPYGGQSPQRFDPKTGQPIVQAQVPTSRHEQPPPQAQRHQLFGGPGGPPGGAQQGPRPGQPYGGPSGAHVGAPQGQPPAGPPRQYFTGPPPPPGGAPRGPPPGQQPASVAPVAPVKPAGGGFVAPGAFQAPGSFN